MIFNSYNTKDTEKFAQKLAVKMPGKIFALVGDLGAGKTTFVQAFLHSLGVKEKITSPTFLIIKNYELLAHRSLKSEVGRIKNKEYKKAYHIDCYRLVSARELLSLDFKKILADPQNIILIEWADKIRDLLPKKGVFWINFAHGNSENERALTISLS